MAASSKTNTGKKTLEDTDFGTEIEIDSTAPLEKIFNDLINREQNSKAYKLYQFLLVQRRTELKDSKSLHYVLPGHPLKIFKENWDGQIPSGYFEPFKYKSTLPQIMSRMRNIGKSDPVTDYMQVKSDWKYKLTAFKKNCTYLSNKKKVQRMNDDVVQCPKFMIDYAAMLDSDPDRNFDSTYNWYYAGNGNMHLVCISWVDYLLHSDHSNLYLTRLHKDSMTIEHENEASFDCDNENILETIYNSSQNVVALRMMNKVIILKIVEIDSHLNFETLKAFESEIPFTSISFDKYHTNILYATRLDSSLSIVNMDRMKARSVKLKRNADSNVNNWNSIIGGERGTFMHIERSTISFYDKRNNQAINCCGVKKIVDEMHCNDITAAMRCDDSPSLYFATDHHLFLMDTRCRSSTKPRAAQRWTHGLRCVPTYISAAKADMNKEFIVMSSQWCKDTCVVSNYADGAARATDVPGVSMAYHPPHVMDSLAAARLRLQCLDPARPPEPRLAAATTGLALADLGETLAILTHNSLGDIIQRTLYPLYMESFIEDDSIQNLKDWCSQIEKEKKSFEVSKVVDITNVWRRLKRVPDSYVFGPSKRRDDFIEKEIFDAFENEELIPELLDAWMEERNQETILGHDSSSALNLHYEDSEGE